MTRSGERSRQRGRFIHFIGSERDIIRLFILSSLSLFPLAEQAPAQSNFLIYTDSLVNGWQNWSWASVNMANTAPVHSGSNSISVTAGPYQGFYPEIVGFDTTTYSSLSFWINGGSSGGQLLQVKGLVNGIVATSSTLPALTANTWQQITVPLSSIGVAANRQFTGFFIEDRSGASQPAFYVDDIQLVGTAPPALVHVSVNAAQVVRVADARMFGVNTAAWDGQLDTPGMIGLLQAMGPQVLRFPGGSTADQYHWASGSWETTFDGFAAVAAAEQAPAVFVTSNYGSGTPAEAAAWVTYSNVTKKYGFKYWEVGNEIYGSWETDNSATPHDPSTYATLFQSYQSQMKAADPTIKIGAVGAVGEDSYVNYPSLSATNPRTGAVHGGWTPLMLAAMNSLGIAPDFLVYHNYGNFTGDAGLLQQPSAWAYDAANLRQQLSDYLGSSGSGVELVCTENNCPIATGSNLQSTSLVDGLYDADSMGQALQTEFNARVWWDLRENEHTPVPLDPTLYGWRSYADDGMVYGAPVSPATCYPTYYCAKMMKYFAAGGDTIVSGTSDYQLLTAYAALRANGSLSLMMINKSPNSTLTGTISMTGFTPAAQAAVYSYGIPQDTAAETGSGSPDIAQTSLSQPGAGFSYAFAPYSVTVFNLPPPLSVTTGTLLSGTFGAPFSQILSASGGTPPCTWSLSAGPLPSGLTLTGSGLLSGTPTLVGTSSFTVQVTDSVSETASQSYPITIQNIPFSAWVSQNFSTAEQANPSISGPNANPNDDGLPNLLEYALNRIPKIQNAKPPLTSAVQYDASTGNNYFTISYTQLKPPCGITYYPGVSSDLLTWYEDAAHVQNWLITDDGNGVTETVTARSLAPVSTTPRFLRLRVTQP